MSVSTKQAFPATPKQPVTDTYHDTTVVDEYRWLENINDPTVREWTAAQNHYTRTILDAIPARAAIYQRLHELYTANSADYYALTKRGIMIYAIKSQPPKEQPLLVTLQSLDDLGSERVILDPTVLDPSGTTTIDFYVPAWDGSIVAVSLSVNGSEEGTLHLYETATGRELGERIPRVTYPTAGGDVAWNADGSGFFYTRYPRGNERPAEDHNFYQQVYYHKLGTPTEEDTYEIGQAFPRIAEIELHPSEDYRYLLATVGNGDGGEYAHYLRDQSGNWSQITHFEDQIRQVAFGTDDALYLLSRQNASRGKVLRLPLATPDLAQAETVIAQGEHTIQNMIPTASRLYVTEQTGGPSQIRVYGNNGSDQGILPTEPVSSIGQVLQFDHDIIVFRSTSFITPPAWYRFDPADEEPVKTALIVRSPANFDDVQVTRSFATSSDGTQIPLNIIHRKGVALNSSNPTILYGYGGFGISLSPSFIIRRQLWMDHGGVYVIANLRGGGEYGEDWHLAGNLTNKQNVFDDFLASAQYLIDSEYTQPARLAIEGGSNGGLLMGAALTQRPDLFRAVISYVGLYDMLRTELEPNGAFNVTEFGTVQNIEQFAALYAYSPFHCVVDGTAYPAAMFSTGENDGRVNPANSRRMTARLQAATSSGWPVLLRTSASAGHGAGTGLNERISQDADVFAFLIDQLGMAGSIN